MKAKPAARPFSQMHNRMATEKGEHEELNFTYRLTLLFNRKRQNDDIFFLIRIYESP